jgi:Helix-turn-helix.
MKNEKILNKLNQIASQEQSKWKENAKWREANSDWLEKSAFIAIKLLRILRTEKMQQNELAAKIGVSPQYINKVVKGQENLSLETICRLEKALGISLIEIPSFETTQVFSECTFHEGLTIAWNKAKPISTDKSGYKEYSNYQQEKEPIAA